MMDAKTLETDLKKRRAEDRKKQRALINAGYRTFLKNERISADTYEALEIRAELNGCSLGEVIDELVEIFEVSPEILSELSDLREALGVACNVDVINLLISEVAGSNPILKMIEKKMLRDTVAADISDIPHAVSLRRQVALSNFAGVKK